MKKFGLLVAFTAFFAFAASAQDDPKAKAKPAAKPAQTAPAAAKSEAQLNTAPAKATGAKADQPKKTEPKKKIARRALPTKPAAKASASQSK